MSEQGISELPRPSDDCFLARSQNVMRSAMYPFYLRWFSEWSSKGFIGVQINQLIKSARVPEPRKALKQAGPGNSKSCSRSKKFQLSSLLTLLVVCAAGNLNQTRPLKKMLSVSVCRQGVLPSLSASLPVSYVSPLAYSRTAFNWSLVRELSQEMHGPGWVCRSGTSPLLR